MPQGDEATRRSLERTIRLGLISDTHGLVRPELYEALRGVDTILHAGDVGAEGVLEQLEVIAPVCAVAGNVDVAVPNLDLPAFERVAFDGVGLLVTHYIGEVDGLLPMVGSELSRQTAQVVVSGHTHRPLLRVHEGRLFVNPGSAGPQRYGLPASCALLSIAPDRSGTQVEAKILNLDEGGVIETESLVVR